MPHRETAGNRKSKIEPARPVSEVDPADLEENKVIAARLDSYAGLLEAQGTEGFRSSAYRRAALEIGALPNALRMLFEEGGAAALVRQRGIGKRIAAAIAEMLTTGHWRQLQRLRGDVTPEMLFQTIPGVGAELAARLADTLDVDTLEELEAALRLGATPVPGIGPRRRAAILAVLEQRLRGLRSRSVAGPRAEPDVALLLDADRLYREKAAAGELRCIAPKRFNPTGVAWLPIMHARRGAWHLTALYSNTARAHELDRTRDWVVIFFNDEDGAEGRRTVVTERRGPLAGRRVVRGREAESGVHNAHETGVGASA